MEQEHQGKVNKIWKIEENWSAAGS